MSDTRHDWSQLSKDSLIHFVGFRVVDYPQGSTVEGTVRHPCYDCGMLVWLSPASMSTIRDARVQGYRTKRRCVDCMMTEAEKVDRLGLAIVPDTHVLDMLLRVSDSPVRFHYLPPAKDQ